MYFCFLGRCENLSDLPDISTGHYSDLPEFISFDFLVFCFLGRLILVSGLPDISTGSCGKTVIFPHLVGFYSSRQNIY